MKQIDIIVKHNGQDGMEDIIDYVMDMLKDRIEDEIDALEDLKDA